MYHFYLVSRFLIYSYMRQAEIYKSSVRYVYLKHVFRIWNDYCEQINALRERLIGGEPRKLPR